MLLPVLVVLTDTPAWILVLIAVGMAIAMTQDCLRYLSIALGDGRAAAYNDALWLIATMCFLVFLHLFAEPAPFAIGAAWTLAALPGVVFGAWSLRWRLRPRRGLWFLQTNARVSVTFVTEWTMRTGVSMAAPYTLGS